MAEIPQITTEEYGSMNVKHTLAIISMTIIILEYILTFRHEVERFWIPRLHNGAAILYYINRYLTLLGHFPVMLEYLWVSMSDKKISICKRLQTYHQYLSLLIQVLIASMLIMRMYALYEKSRRVLVLYFSVSLATVIVGCWGVISSKNNLKTQPVLVPNGCGNSLSHNSAVRLGAAWTGMLVFDVLVFGMTLYKSLTLPGVRGIGLLKVLLRDGAVYFGVMVATNLANIITFIAGGLYTRGALTMFTNTMSSILISRLMLNLRDPALMPQGQQELPTRTVAHGCSGYPVLTTVLDTYNTMDNDDEIGGKRNTARIAEIEDAACSSNPTDIEMIPSTQLT